ncbi:MAG: hypothetical protein ACYC4R_05295 [Anaerolineae bacterium]
MADIWDIAKQRAERLAVRNILVPTAETGKTVRRALEVFGPGYRYYAVGNPSSSYARGLCLHKGISPGTRRELEALGIQVILESQSITQAWALGGERRSINGRFFDVWGKASPRNVPLDVLMEHIGSEGPYTLMLVLAHAMEWMGEGGRVCIECMLMAADSGVLPLDERCLVIATPVDPEVADVCMVLRPAKTADVFTWKLVILDLATVNKPRAD